MQINQKIEPARSRFTALDFVKGFVMLVMASLHCEFFFFQPYTALPFKWFDPFVFPCFLLYFGLGNGLSRRPKRLSVLNKLVLAYLVGGLPSAVFVDLLENKELRAHILTSSIFDNLLGAVLLRNRLDYADFLVPFITAYIFFFICQFLFQKFNLWTIIIGIFISIGCYIMGELLTHIAPNGILKDFYNEGFRSLQSLPIFISGVCIGLFLRQKEKIPILKRTFYILACTILLILICVSYKHHAYHISLDSSWKKSGDLSYILTGIAFPILFLWVVDNTLKYFYKGERYSIIIALMEQIGKNTMKCLWVQFLLFPILGYMVISNSFFHWLRAPLAIAAIALMCWITVDNGSLWRTLKNCYNDRNS